MGSEIFRNVTDDLQESKSESKFVKGRTDHASPQPDSHANANLPAFDSHEAICFGAVGDEEFFRKAEMGCQEKEWSEQDGRDHNLPLQRWFDVFGGLDNLA